MIPKKKLSENTLTFSDSEQDLLLFAGIDLFELKENFDEIQIPFDSHIPKTGVFFLSMVDSPVIKDLLYNSDLISFIDDGLGEIIYSDNQDEIQFIYIKSLTYLNLKNLMQIILPELKSELT